MNLALEKGERVTMGGISRGEVGGEAGEVTGVVANVPIMNGLGKRYKTFSRWGMAAGKEEVLLVVMCVCTIQPSRNWSASVGVFHRPLLKAATHH